MTTTTTGIPAWLIEHLENETSYIEIPSYPDFTSSRTLLFFILLAKWLLRVTCIVFVFICPWANYKLIRFLQTHPFHKECSAKWYVIFKAAFDSIYILVSIPFILCLTFNIDLIHKHFLTCKLITYMHYLSDDLISIMLTLLCIDRMIRITCGHRLRERFSLIVCIVAVIFFVIINIHHIIRLQYQYGFCHKTYIGLWDYDFDIYYSFIYTSLTWTVIFITSLNLTVSIYCYRARRLQLQKQQQPQNKTERVSSNGKNSLGLDSDRVELIHSTDDWEEPTAITIEQNESANGFVEREQQDNFDLQMTVCVLIVAAIFLACNLPNFIIFIMRFIFHSGFTSAGYFFVYVSLYPLLIAHTISYFVFNHLAARLFPNH